LIPSGSINYIFDNGSQDLCSVQAASSSRETAKEEYHQRALHNALRLLLPSPNHKDFFIIWTPWYIDIKIEGTAVFSFVDENAVEREREREREVLQYAITVYGLH
jgi:hypothetical protein